MSAPLAVRAGAVPHAFPVRLAAGPGAFVVAAGPRLVAVAPRPRRPPLALARLGLACPLPCTPLGCGLPAPGRLTRPDGLPLATPLGCRVLPLPGLEVGLRRTGVRKATLPAARPALPRDRRL